MAEPLGDHRKPRCMLCNKVLPRYQQDRRIIARCDRFCSDRCAIAWALDLACWYEWQTGESTHGVPGTWEHT